MSRTPVPRDDPADAAPGGNIPEYSVSEISGAVKRALEAGFGRVRVRGEITELKRYPSGHVYLSLKDENAKIAAVIWRNAVARVGLAPENGVEVIATGRVTAYGERSSYQLQIERLEYAGAGALLARIEALRLRLGAEGLFDAASKRALPLLPRLIGVVTSPSGAVLHDIRTTIARRFPRDLLVWPVPVQGEHAAARIADAIDGFDRLPADGATRRPDVLIVARGGGSLEDLMAFNDEAVVRAAARCRIPLISAVGHETDTTLIDFAADRRAPTPTAAAELAVPVRATLAADLNHRGARLASALARIADAFRLRLGRSGARLPDLPTLLGQGRMRLDDRHHRLALAMPNLLDRRRVALHVAERHFPTPHALIATRGASLGLGAARLDGAAKRRLAEARHRIDRVLLRPNALDAALREKRFRLGVLARGLASAVVAHPAARVAALVRASTRLDDALARVLARARAGNERAALRPASLERSLREGRARLDGLGGRLRSVSHEGVLARGYVLVERANTGERVTSAASVRPGARLVLRFGDGDARVRAEQPPRDPGQGALDV